MELGGGISYSYSIRALPAESLVSESGRTAPYLYCVQEIVYSPWEGREQRSLNDGIKRRLHAELRYAVLDTSLNQ